MWWWCHFVRLSLTIGPSIDSWQNFGYDLNVLSFPKTDHIFDQHSSFCSWSLIVFFRVRLSEPLTSQLSESAPVYGSGTSRFFFGKLYINESCTIRPAMCVRKVNGINSDSRLTLKDRDRDKKCKDMCFWLINYFILNIDSPKAELCKDSLKVTLVSFTYTYWKQILIAG